MASNVPDDLPTPELIQEVMFKPKAERPVAKPPSIREADEGAPKGGLPAGLNFSNASQASDLLAKKPRRSAVATTSKRERDREPTRIA